MYGLSLDSVNPLEKYKLIERLAPFWRSYASEATAYAMVICLDRFIALKTSTRKKVEDISLTTEDIDQLTHFLESLLPIIRPDYGKKIYGDLQTGVNRRITITRRFTLNSLKESSQDAGRVEALKKIEALLSSIDTEAFISTYNILTK